MNNLKILVPENRFENLILRLQKFQRKASLLNVGRVDWTFSEPKIEKIENQFCEVREFVIMFPDIRIGDWSIVGKIEPLSVLIDGEVHSIHEKNSPENKNLLSAVPGNDISEFEHWDCSCEHCGINRLRKRLFVVQKDSERKVVGVSCLKDFVGHDVKSTLMFYSQVEILQNEFSSFHFRQPEGMAFDSYVKKIVGVVEQINHKKFKFDGDDIEVGSSSSTKYNVFRLGVFGLTEDIETNTDFVKVHSENILNNISEFKKKESVNDFEKKILLFYDAGFMPESKVNILLGLIGRYFSNVETKLEKKFDPTKSEFFGKVGEQVQLNVGIERAFTFDSQYGGGVCIVGWVIGTNNGFTWFASGKVEDFVMFSQEEQKYFPVYSEYKIVATVKKHDDNLKYGKKTMLTRVRLLKK